MNEADSQQTLGVYTHIYRFVSNFFLNAMSMPYCKYHFATEICSLHRCIFLFLYNKNLRIPRYIACYLTVQNSNTPIFCQQLSFESKIFFFFELCPFILLMRIYFFHSCSLPYQGFENSWSPDSKLMFDQLQLPIIEFPLMRKDMMNCLPLRQIFSAF